MILALEALLRRVMLGLPMHLNPFGGVYPERSRRAQDTGIGQWKDPEGG